MWVVLIILLLTQLTAAVTCEKVDVLQISTAAEVWIEFSFETWGLVFGNPQTLASGQKNVVWGVDFYITQKALAYSTPVFVKWDRELKYAIEIEYFDSSESWRVEEYVCKHGGVVYTYYKLTHKPEKMSKFIEFTVSSTSARYSARQFLKVSIPIQRYLHSVCVELPDDDSWPSCRKKFVDENVVKWGRGQTVWTALEINGRRPGESVDAGFVRVTIPNPLYYTDHGAYNDLGIYSAILSTDLSRGQYISDVWQTPFLRRITLTVTAVPSKWGSVKLSPPRPLPLYISTVTLNTSCAPPQCFVIDAVGNSTWVGTSWRWRGTLRSIAIKTGEYLTPHVAVTLGGKSLLYNDTVEVKMPLGSIAKLGVSIFWKLRDLWVDSHATYLRVVDNFGIFVNYEAVARSGKLYYKPQAREASLYVALDGEFSQISTAWYSPPNPCRQWPRQTFDCLYSQHVYTKYAGGWVGYAKVGPPGGTQWPLSKLTLVNWLVGGQVCREGGFRDLMSLVWGDPHLYYHHVYRVKTYAFNPQSGDFDILSECVSRPPHQVSLLSEVYRAAEYRNTTLGVEPLLHQTADPTYGNFYNYQWEKVDGGVELPAGWSDALPLGLATLPTNSSPRWLVSIIPTTACTNIMCLEVDAALWPPGVALALPGVGYSFSLTYLGSEKNVTLRMWVEAGYVVDSTFKWGRNISLVQLTRRWRPMDTLYVGPGWHLDYKPVEPCQPIAIGKRPIYVTPVNYTGPLQIVLEEVETGSKYFYIFFVTNQVSYLLKTTTVVPQVFKNPQLDMSIYLYLEGVPYFHGINVFSGGGRQYPFRCIHNGGLQTVARGEFTQWFEMVGRVEFVDRVSEPRYELLSGGIVKITAEGPVVGYAFYLNRNGSWVKVAEAAASVVYVNASRIFPWDPLLVLPIVRQETLAKPGLAVDIWRPKARLLYKTWADQVGYPLGDKSRYALH